MEDKKKPENIGIDSEPFEEMLDELDERIKVVLDEIYDGKDFQSGDIALKITLGVDDKTKDYPVLKQGQVITKQYKYKGLEVKHNITTTLKKTDKASGEYSSEKELVKNGKGEYVEVPVKNSQMGMFDGGDGK